MLTGPFTGRVLDIERRRFAGAGAAVAGLVVFLALPLSAACGGAPDSDERAEEAPAAGRSSTVASRELVSAEERVAADYRALVCEALYALYGRADRRGFVLARLRATYLWDGALSAAWRRALAPHRDYLEALLDPGASATRAAISSALSRADPHFAAVCKATGVPP